MSPLDGTPLVIDIDTHQEGDFLFYFITNYLYMTYEVLKELDYDFIGKTVLDIGVGHGRGLSLYERLGVKKVMGIDVSREETDYAVTKAERLGIKLEVVVDTADNQYLRSLPDESFEIISVMYTLFCLPQDYMRVNIIREVKRILKPGGTLIIMDAQRYSMIHFLNRVCMSKRRRFLTHRELLKPLEPVAKGRSGYFYFLNTPANWLAKCFGSGIYSLLDKLMKSLRVPASMVTLVFRKLR